jgi:hypothetical protein
MTALHPVLIPRNSDSFYQCELRRGDERTIGWVETRAAKCNARVEIKGDGGGLWTVAAVYQPPQSHAWLREKQRKDRASLRSIR